MTRDYFVTVMISTDRVIALGMLQSAGDEVVEDLAE